jgi:DNA-binding transcriptional LysR family regulator
MGEPSGLLRVSCPVAIAQVQLAAVLPAFLARHPKVRMQLLVSNRRVDLIDEGIDVAIRVRNRIDEDPGLIVRAFGSIRELLVASPGYLGLHGAPAHPVELAGHRILSMLDEPGMQRWELFDAECRAAKVEFEPRIAVKDFPLLQRLALDGLGIALLPESVCADALQAGHLQQVLPGWDLPLGICHASFASRRGMLPALRAFIDHLAAEFPRLLPAPAVPVQSSKPSA